MHLSAIKKPIWYLVLNDNEMSALIMKLEDNKGDPGDDEIIQGIVDMFHSTEVDS